MKDSRLALTVGEAVGLSLSILPADIWKQLMVTRLDISGLHGLKLAQTKQGEKKPVPGVLWSPLLCS